MPDGGDDEAAAPTPEVRSRPGYVYGDAPPVLTHHNDLARTGAHARETVLGPATLGSGRFGLAFSRQVQGMIYGQPLFVPKLEVRGKRRDVVFVATEHDDAYAFDAEDPTATEPLWHVSFGASIPSTDFDADQGTPYRDILPELGVTSTPVIDPIKKTIYFFAQTKEAGVYFNRLHALDLATGAERANSPVEITVSAPGTGEGSTSGVVTIPPKFVLQRPALAFTGGALWIVGGGHGDFGPYHGWVKVLTPDLASISTTLLTTPSGWAGGIWQAGGGPAGDELGAANTMFVETGNGTYDDQTQPPDLSESFLRVDATVVCPEGFCAVTDGPRIADWFTPHDHEALDTADLDLGSSGPMILPKTDVLVGGGKSGKLYVLDRTKLGHRSADDAQILQSFAATTGELYAGLVTRDAAAGKLVYVAGQGDAIKAYRFIPSGPTGTFDTTPFAASTWTVPSGTPGAGMSLTSRANTPGTSVLWMLTQSSSNDGSWVPGDATLRAFDADDLRELWSSATHPSDAIGRYVKFTVPTVAGGRVFVPSVDVLRVYALRTP